MKTIHFLTSVILFMFCTSLSAQDATKTLNLINNPNTKIDNSLYNSLQYLDSRQNKENFGFVFTSLFNEYNVLIDGTPMSEQFGSIFHSSINETAQDRTLFIQLRELNFSEIISATSEKGNCNIRINLYEKKDSLHYPLAVLDTIIEVKAIDVTGKLIRSSSNAITSFITDNLVKIPDYQQPYLLHDIENIEYIEKSKLKLYQAGEYVDGLYRDFRSFANQTPYKTKLTPKFDKLENIKEIKATYETLGYSEKLKPKDIYAVVIDGKAFIATDKSYIPIFKENNDIVFWNDGSIKITTVQLTGKGNFTKRRHLFVGAYMGGVLFSLSFPDPNPYTSFDPHTTRIKMKLDHLNGNFIMVPMAPLKNKEDYDT